MQTGRSSKYSILNINQLVGNRVDIINKLDNVLAIVDKARAAIETEGGGAFKLINSVVKLSDKEAEMLPKFTADYLKAISMVAGTALIYLREEQARLYHSQTAKAIKNDRIGKVVDLHPSDNSQKIGIDLVRSEYENSLKQRIFDIAESIEPLAKAEREFCGRNLAAALLSSAEVKENLSALKNPNSLESRRLQTSVDIMQRARRAANGDPALIVEKAIDIIQEEHKSFPALVVYTDFNGGITRDTEPNQLLPGALTNRLVRAIEDNFNIPKFFRQVLTDEPGLVKSMNQSAGLIATEAARSCSVYNDYTQFCRKLTHVDAHQSVLTTEQKHYVQSIIKILGVNNVAEILAQNANYNVQNKGDIITNALIHSENPPIVLVLDADSSELEDRILHRENNPFVDAVIWASRRNMPFATNVGDALSKKRILFIDEQYETFGRGFTGCINLVDRYRKRSPNTSNLFVAKPVEFPYDRPYEKGDIVRACIKAVEKSNIPVPIIFTLTKPIHEPIPSGEMQHDLGVPTLLKCSDGKYVVLYKAATMPSGQTTGHPSNVYAATFDPNTSKVEFFDEKTKSDSPRGIKPLLTSSLSEAYAKDGLHDPRATYIASLDKWFILACGFHKQKEKDSIKAAGSDTSKRIHGAYTELFTAEHPDDPSSYKRCGIFGPDFHYKNMVFFPETRVIEGKECLIALTRRMPCVQVVYIPIEALDGEYWGNNRVQFWNEELKPENLDTSTVLKPVLAHEGYGNPFGPYNHNTHTQNSFGEGQVASGGTPIQMTIKNSLGQNQKVWLVIYNSVPDNREEDQFAYGRVICGALLDYDNPRKLVCRSSLPLIVPRDNAQFETIEGMKPRTDYVAFCGGACIDNEGGLVVAYTGGDSTIEIARWSSALEIAHYIAQFGPNGEILKEGLSSEYFPPLRLASGS